MPANQDCTELRIDEEFLAIVCNDEQFLRSEFEEIIAAEWAPSRPGPKVGTGQLPLPPSRASWKIAFIQSPLRTLRPGVGEWSRQRSPPGEAPTRTG
jgi:hypothetical protein